jgi:hypothetical protein
LGLCSIHRFFWLLYSQSCMKYTIKNPNRSLPTYKAVGPTIYQLQGDEEAKHNTLLIKSTLFNGVLQLQCHRIRCKTVERNWEHDFYYIYYKVTRSETQQNVPVGKKRTNGARSYNTNQWVNKLAIQAVTSLVI